MPEPPPLPTSEWTAYHSRWDRIWNQHPGGDTTESPTPAPAPSPLPPGAAFDAKESSPALISAFGKGGICPAEGRSLLVPGCGRGYDVRWGIRAGAVVAHGLEISPTVRGQNGYGYYGYYVYCG